MAKLSDAEFLRNTAHNRLIGNAPYEIARRVLDISYRLEALDAREPSEAECIVWAMRNGHVWAVYTCGEFSHWQYDFRDGMTRHLEYDGNLPFLTPEVLTDIRRRMKEAKP